MSDLIQRMENAYWGASRMGYVRPEVRMAAALNVALEEAAAIADSYRWDTTSLMSLPPQSSAAFNIAAAIRALKEKPND